MATNYNYQLYTATDLYRKLVPTPSMTACLHEAVKYEGGAQLNVN